MEEKEKFNAVATKLFLTAFLCICPPSEESLHIFPRSRWMSYISRSHAMTQEHFDNLLFENNKPSYNAMHDIKYHENTH